MASVLWIAFLLAVIVGSLDSLRESYRKRDWGWGDSWRA